MSRSRFRADLSPPEMASRIQLACEDHRLSCRGSAGRLRRLRPDPESERSDPRCFPVGRHCRSDRGYCCRSSGITRRRTRCPRWPRDAGIVDQRQPHADHRFFTGSLGRADYVCELRGQQHRVERADAQCRRRRTPEPDDIAGNGLDGVDPIARPNRLSPRLATIPHSAAFRRSAADGGARDCGSGAAGSSTHGGRTRSGAVGGVAPGTPGADTSSATGAATASAASVPGLASSGPLASAAITPQRAGAADRSRCVQSALLASHYWRRPIHRAPQSDDPYARNCR